MTKQEWILTACANLPFDGSLHKRTYESATELLAGRFILLDTTNEAIQRIEHSADLLEQKGYFDSPKQ